MIAKTPEELDTLFVDALNAADLDALTSLYEANASLMPEPGRVVTGKDAIRAALAGFIAAKATMTLNPRTLAHAGDIALVSAHWRAAMTDQKGEQVTAEGHSVEVMRHQPDGRWLFVIDFPFGVAAT